MPRDLETDKPGPTVTLTESPGRVTGSPKQSQRQFVIIPQDQQINSPAKIHPYTRPLTISDLDSVVALENAAFSDPGERATREKLIYRLTKCGELSLGIFCTVIPGSGIEAETFATGRLVETSRKNGAISVLLGHIISTNTTSLQVTNDSMAYPSDWDLQNPTESNLGHQEQGRTIALHSVAILPKFQGKGLGRVLMTAYMQQMNGAGIADRLALIAHDHKVQWYEKLGFTNKGKSSVTFGGGVWYDMIFDLKRHEARARYG